MRSWTMHRKTDLSVMLGGSMRVSLEIIEYAHGRSKTLLYVFAKPLHVLISTQGCVGVGAVDYIESVRIMRVDRCMAGMSAGHVRAKS
jgi:hypothetical protein